MSKKIKIVFHVHSRASADSLFNSKEQLIKTAQKSNIDCLVITDHNEIYGALEMAQGNSIRIIVGEEIKTSEGEIIGLFLKEKIEPDLSLQDTIKQIRQQGGLTLVPHPSDRLRKNAIGLPVVLNNIKDIDMIEVANSRTIFKNDDHTTKLFAQEQNLIAACGSDAHSPIELGKSYMEIDDFTNPQEFLQSVAQGKMICGYSPIWVHLRSKIKKLL